MGGLWRAVPKAHLCQLGTLVEMSKYLLSSSSPVDVMLVSYIPKEPYLALRHEHGNTQSMYWCISKSFVVKASSSIQPVKVSFIRLTAKEVKVSNFEVREELAVVVIPTIVGVQQPVQVGIRMYQLRMRVDERAGARPEGGERASVVEDIHVETVLHVIIVHKAEHVVVDIAEEVDLTESMSVSKAKGESY